METGQRIRRIREHGGHSQEEFARLLGVSVRTLVRYERGERDPSAKLMSRAESFCADQTDLTMSRDYSLHQRYVFIPLYGVEASAGPGALVEGEPILEIMALGREWIRRELGADPGRLSLLFMRGDSMTPTLQPGEMLLLERVEGSQIGDGICVIRLDADLLVKRIQRLPGGKLQVGSDNPAYQPFVVDVGGEAAEVAVVGRVIWAGRRL